MKLLKKSLFSIVLLQLCFLVEGNQAFAQEPIGSEDNANTFSLCILDRTNDLGLAFCPIKLGTGENTGYTDLEGCLTFHAKLDSIEVEVRRFGYKKIKVKLFKGQNSRFYLKRETQKGLKFTHSSHAELLIKKLKQKKNDYDFMKKPFHYSAYTKVTLSTDEVKMLSEKLIQKTKGLFSRVLEVDSPKHIYLMEYLTVRDYHNERNQFEYIKDIKSSGSIPNATLAMLTHIQPVDVFSPYLKILGKEYVSPLGGSPIKRYYFTVIDVSIWGQDTIYCLHFRPKNKYSPLYLEGELFLTSKMELVAIFAKPSFKKKMEVYFMQRYGNLGEFERFPHYSEVEFSLGGGLLPSKGLLLGKSKLTILEVEKESKKSKKDMDEVVVDYSINEDNNKADLIEEIRPNQLTQKDSNTYSHIGSKRFHKILDQSFLWGLNLYYRQFSLGPFDIDTKKILYFNDYEGLRLGFGVKTNERFSKNFRAGAWAGYGQKDKRTKMGVEVSTRLEKQMNLWVGLRLEDDLNEQGRLQFMLDRPQYRSEVLRKYRLRRMDRRIERSVFLTFNPIKYVHIIWDFDAATYEPLYRYRFNPTQDSTSFSITSTRAALRLSYGEQVKKIDDYEYPMTNSYPELWFQIRRGIKFNNNGYDFGQVQAKIQQRVKMLGLGIIAYQVTAGIGGAVPAPILFSSPGSFRVFSAVSHNTFETMGYNEFLHNKFVHVFTAYEPGSIYFGKTWSTPYFVFVQNFGWGRATNKSDHQYIELKEMPKGYFESGVIAKNLLTLKIGGVKSGFGIGIFTRYGPYAESRLDHNTVVKFALTLGSY